MEGRDVLSRVCVVIPVLDGVDTLPAVLDALFHQRTSFDVNVVIVDSGSQDGSPDLVKRYPVQLIRIPSCEFNHGDTRNLGISHGTGEVAVLLTQDAIPVSRDFLTEIVRPFNDSQIAGVYGRQIPRTDCDVVTARNLRSWMTGRDQSARAQLGKCSLEHLDPMQRYELCVFDNVCAAVRRTTWEKIPYPTSEFGEDIAWGKNVICRGWTIAYAPEAAVIHSHRRSVAYEYRRTRICHETLNKLFGVATVPGIRDMFRSVSYNLRTDIPYVWRNVSHGLERWRQLVRVASLSVLGPIAQYQGVRDAGRRAGSA